MEPEQTTPQPETEQHFAHTYQDDMSKAMNATDVTEVQSLLTQAREQEAEEIITVTERREKSWYSTTSFLLIVLTLAVLAYGAYYYMHLTVPIQPVVSVGVFSNTDPIATSNSSIGSVMATLRASTTLPAGKPVLVNLVGENNVALTNTQLYSFIGAELSQPLQTAIESARLGVVNTGKDILPFVIVSVPNPEKASNAFTSEEPLLFSEFSQLFNTTEKPVAAAPAENSQQAALSALVASQKTSTPAVTAMPVTSSTFQSQYFYNLPVRSLTGTDTATGEQRIVFLYGYANNNVIVITSTPEVLKAVYDTLITQH
ncbi:MAG: hypothetical protein JWL92_91 [Candidatus Nomurabacteria bacterium]|nr:hypothetical protein [Candidatus Nomurabacteria bacterium]